MATVSHTSLCLMLACPQATAVGVLWSDPVKMIQQLSAMLGTLAIQDTSHPPETYLKNCDHSRAALAYLAWGKRCLQGAELSGKDMHRYVLWATCAGHHWLHHFCP
jgi:hypothetical protein